MVAIYNFVCLEVFTRVSMPINLLGIIIIMSLTRCIRITIYIVVMTCCVRDAKYITT